MNIGNGCGSCETLNPMEPNIYNQINTPDYNSNMIAAMIGNNAKDINEKLSGIQNLAVSQQPPQPVAQTKPLRPAHNNNNASNLNYNDNNVSGRVANYIMFGLIAISALAWHEMIKVYINNAIKFNDGTPTYFVSYAVLATVACIIAYTYLK